MNQQYIFNFKTDVSGIEIPEKMNNPFGLNIHQIAKIAAREFQEYISEASKEKERDIGTRKGKMFGVLVVQKEDNSYGFLGTVSGVIPKSALYEKFVPSIFNDSTDNYFINKGMTALTEIGNRIKLSNNQTEITELKESRKLKSHALQQQLFENYSFLNAKGREQNLLEIFKNSEQGKRPSAAGECAAPKLLQYAFQHKLKPVAIAEFWWGSPSKSKEKTHGAFYAACKNKCRPILEFMLSNSQLFNQANAKNTSFK